LKKKECLAGETKFISKSKVMSLVCIIWNHNLRIENWEKEQRTHLAWVNKLSPFTLLSRRQINPSIAHCFGLRISPLLAQVWGEGASG